MTYDGLWRVQFGPSLISASDMLGRTGAANGAYEVLFQLAVAMALPSSE